METRQKVDWELALLAMYVFALGIASLWEALLPQLSPLTRSLLLGLGVVLAVLGTGALYVDPHLESRWAFWFVLAKDVAIAVAFLMLGLVLSGSGC